MSVVKFQQQKTSTHAAFKIVKNLVIWLLRAMKYTVKPLMT